MKELFPPLWLAFTYLLSTSTRLWNISGNEMFHYCYIIQHLKTLESCVSQILLGNMQQQKSPWQTTLST